MMAAEEQAAVEWLEGMSEPQHMHYFRPPAGEVAGLFSVKRDHERTSYGVCFQCAQNEALVVVE